MIDCIKFIMLNKNITANYVKNTDEMPLFMEINSNYIYGLKSVRESIPLMSFNKEKERISFYYLLQLVENIKKETK